MNIYIVKRDKTYDIDCISYYHGAYFDEGSAKAKVLHLKEKYNKKDWNIYYDIIPIKDNEQISTNAVKIQLDFLRQYSDEFNRIHNVGFMPIFKEHYDFLIEWSEDAISEKGHLEDGSEDKLKDIKKLYK